MPADPQGAALTGPSRPLDGVRASDGDVAHRMTRQVRREVRSRGNRSDARTAATVRDAERLVQVEVAHVGAEGAGSGQTDERVQVGAVDVDLAAGVVHRSADLGDRLLEDAVRGRVGDHQRRQPVLVRRRSWPVGRRRRRRRCSSALDDDHPHARHHGTRGVRPVRRGRDETDVAFLVAVRSVVRARSPAARRARPGSRRWAGARPRRSR